MCLCVYHMYLFVLYGIYVCVCVACLLYVCVYLCVPVYVV